MMKKMGKEQGFKVESEEVLVVVLYDSTISEREATEKAIGLLKKR